MKKEISLKLWLAVLTGGIVQFVRNIFSWKKMSTFWRVIACIITACVLFMACVTGYVFYDEYYARPHRHADYHAKTFLGNRLEFYNGDPGKSYIYNIRTDEKVLDGLDWIARSEDGDSLVVFAKEGKRGFLSRWSGDVIIPAKYDAAWCFNDGVAAVCVADSVFFIDHAGKPIISRKYRRTKEHNYMYHGQCFANRVGDKLGLVDRAGNDVSPVIYDELHADDFNMWVTKIGDKYGVISDKGAVIAPNEYAYVTIYHEGGIVVTNADNSMKQLNYEGKVTAEFVYGYSYPLDYYSDEIDSEGERVKKPANLWYYTSNNHFGLIDKNGHPVTPPVYQRIEAFSADLFECQIDDGGERILLNSKGQPVN